MSNEAETSGIREAVGVFMGADDLKRAGDALLSAGFDRAALGLLASEEAVESSLGDLYARANAFAGQPQATHQGLVRHEAVGSTVHAWLGGLSVAGTTAFGAVAVASSAVLGGALVAAAAGAATLGAIGALMRAIVHESDAEHLQKEVDHGRLLLFARTNTAAEEQRATGILLKNNALEAKVYDVPVPGPSGQRARRSAG
jgi:hypothetical protein